MKSLMSLGVIIASVLLMGMVVGASSMKPIVFSTNFSGGVPNWVHTVNATVGTYNGTHMLIVNGVQNDIEHYPIALESGVEIGYGVSGLNNITNISEESGSFSFSPINSSKIEGLFFVLFVYNHSSINADADLDAGTLLYEAISITKNNGNYDGINYVASYLNKTNKKQFVNLGKSSKLTNKSNLSNLNLYCKLKKTENQLVATISFTAYSSPTAEIPYFENITTISDLSTNYSIDKLDFKLIGGLYDEDTGKYDNITYGVSSAFFTITGTVINGNGGNNMGGNTNSTGNNTSQNNTSQNNILGTNNYMTVGVIILVSGVVIGVIYYVIRARKH